MLSAVGVGDGGGTGGGAGGTGGNLGFDGWRNPIRPLDVNADGIVSALDALVVINLLNRQGITQVSGPRAPLGGPSGGLVAASGETTPFYDVNNDGLVSALDALHVINKLNTADGEQVRIRLEATNTSGTMIAAAGLGEDFLVNVYVTDLRVDPVFPGVFQAYTDIDYVSTLVSVNGAVTFGADYPNGPNADTSVAGLIDEAGAFDGFTPLGLEERLLFTVPFTADAEGVATFTLNPADDAGHTVLTFGSDVPVPSPEIEFVNTMIVIGEVPTVSIGDVTVTEGGATAVFTVNLSAPGPVPVTVDFVTGDDTATAGADYEDTSGTLTFDVGVTSRTISVPIIDDAINELSEEFFVSLFNVSGATLGDGLAVGTILDDDTTPEVSISDVTRREGRGVDVNAVFEVTLSAPSGLPVTVDFSTMDGTAVAGQDYETASGQLMFAPGVTSQTVTVTILADALEEPDETFTVQLGAVTNAVVVDSEGLGTILDSTSKLVRIRLETFDQTGMSEDQFDVGDTILLRAFVEDLRSAAEGVFQAFLDVFYDAAVATLGTPITFGADYANNRQFIATQPGVIDEIGATDGSTPLGPGERLLFEAPFTAAANGAFEFLADPADVLGHEVAVFGVDGFVSTADVDYVSTIVQVGGPPSLSINDVTAVEGGAAQFTVSLSHSTLGAVMVGFATSNGTAVAGADYTTTSGTLSFPQGVLTQTITVPVLTDSVPELDETFLVDLANPVGAVIEDGQGEATILATPPELSINSVSVVEGNSGTTNAVFTVSLSVGSTRTVTVDFATAGVTATSGVDFQPVSGTLTFAAGETVKTIPVPVIGDFVDETNETFEVRLSAATNATIAAPRGIGTIIDDEISPSSIAGFVYVDSNNNGVKDPGERGIPAVKVMLTGTPFVGGALATQALTGPDGSYRFAGLPPGSYSLSEVQPGFFLDGPDTVGTSGGIVVNDRMAINLAEETDAQAYNFGELGLRSRFLFERLFLGPMPRDGEVINLNLDSGGMWFSFDDGFSTLSATAFSNVGRPLQITLYDKNVIPLVTTAAAPNGQLNFFEGVPGEAFFLKISGGGSSVNLSLSIDGGATNSNAGAVDAVVGDETFLSGL